MITKGTDGLMLARNRIRKLLRERGKPDTLVCELTREITCCDEGLTVTELFAPEEAEQIIAHCDLVCPVPAPRQQASA
ncbi:MAG: hypothetical protein QHH80_07290 [Anaerolineae bacterium]|nr:hypothetical protein [Anaerolineae bacterium]